MRYTYENGVIGLNVFGYNVEAANVGGREWRLAIVKKAGAVLNKFIKSGEYAEADYGDIPDTEMFWSFDHTPTIGTVIKTIKEYKQHRAEHEEFMRLIGAKV